MSTRPRRRSPGIRRAVLAGAVLCVSLTTVLAGATTPAGTAPSAPHAVQGSPLPAAALPAGSAAPAAVSAHAVPASAASPGIPRQTDPNADYGIRFKPITTRAQRSKVRISLPLLVFHTYLTVCFLSPSFNSPCPGHDVSGLPKLPFDYTWDVAFADNWIARRVDGRTVYGEFPPVRVSLLAFGSIPVSATVHLTQTVHNGVYDPLKLKLPIDVSPVPPGRRIPGYGPAPKFSTGPTFFSYLAVIDGDVDIRLSDVTVDKVPLDVGPSCATATPAHLRLTAPDGYYPGNVPPGKLRGGPGEFQPLGGNGPAGYLQGNADIPAFSGCHNGADDLDRLITNFVSGPTNAVSAYAPSGLQSWCSEPIARCGAAANAAQQFATTVRTPAQLRAALATAAGRKALTQPAPAVQGPTP